MTRKWFCCLGGLVMALSSCSDLFETESERQIFEPSLSEKTDSMFYLLGIMKGVQQVADQYVLTNEMRGDLVATNSYTETSLRQLANFNVDATNKLDSAYLYYRIVNNCNYFIAHRDSNLRTGSTRVTIPEIAQAHAVRAWAYLQLVKNYGRVPFYTNPIVTIGSASHISDSIDFQNIVSRLAPDLLRYVGVSEPDYSWLSAGVPNTSSEEKKIYSKNIMIPVEVILGDLYLETHQYESAARAYYNYIKRTSLSLQNFCTWPDDRSSYSEKLPANLPETVTDISSWTSIFAVKSPKDSVTTIPMAANRLRGVVSSLPRYFGYNYYSTLGGNDMYLIERQIEPSPAYKALADAQSFYYKPTGNIDTVLVAEIGDMRRHAAFTTFKKNDSTLAIMNKFNSANIPLYRGATVYLRLAEALNRWGYSDVAFAILKEGIKPSLLASVKTEVPKRGQYLNPASEKLLTEILPFVRKVDDGTTVSYWAVNGISNAGIHSRGTYKTDGIKTPYQFDAIVGSKISEMVARDGLVPQGNKNDTILAVEDLLCDEMALELAFEGCRFGDLTRIARHRNNTSDPVNVYGANFGSKWLAKKLAFKQPAVSLEDEKNWYLRFR